MVSINNVLKSFKGMSKDEKKSVAGLSGEDRTRAMAQLRLQKQAELTAFITNILKSKHDSAMAVVDNVRP